MSSQQSHTREKKEHRLIDIFKMLIDKYGGLQTTYHAINKELNPPRLRRNIVTPAMTSNKEHRYIKANWNKIPLYQIALNLKRCKKFVRSHGAKIGMPPVSRIAYYKQPQALIVINLETGIYYDSCLQAAKAHGMVRSTLSRMVTGAITNKTPIVII